MVEEKELMINRISKSNVKIVSFITSVFSYLFILVCSCMIIYFSNKRGNPIALNVLYYIALSLNILQILLIVGQFIVQQLGIFDRLLRKIENILALVWETVIIAEFICACVLFKAFRLDSLLIALAQGLAIALMLLYSKKIDYKINKKYNKKSQKKGESLLHNSSIIRKRDLSKNILYVLACAVIFVVEFMVLIMPKLPPRIDDIFTENRVLQYTYCKDVNGHTGYCVSDVYYGTNDKIVIPLTYNDKPVLGILKNAISDVGTINSIQIGEYNTNGDLMSNVELIESSGIKLDKIKEINLPNSIKSMAVNAISGKNIKTINLYSNSNLEFASFNTANLETINLKNKNSTIQADYENFNGEVNVPETLYNQYREKFFANRNVFNIINDEQFIIVDFETDTNKYLNSQILYKTDPNINITSLKNEEEETSTFIQDTVLYNSNHYMSDGFSSKSGYAFRGWFRDAKYALECVFNDINDIKFNADTTIYARWYEIKTIELDWSKYYPYNENITTIHYIASPDMNESITFPKLVSDGGDVERAGFSSLNWKYGNTCVEKTQDLLGSIEKTIRLKAEWELVTPNVSYETIINNTVYQGSNLSFTFDESQIINFKAPFSHSSNEVSITCNWKKKNENGTYVTLQSIVTTNNDIFNYSIRNVSESGIYELEVIAKATTGETSTVTQSYNININKKDLDISSFGTMNPVTKIYNGTPRELDYSYSVPPTIKVSKAYDIDGNYSYLSMVGPINAQSDSYSVRYTFERIDTERDNYNVEYSYSNITITPKPVTAIWEQSGIGWDSNLGIVYDGHPHNLIPTVNGKCGNDIVEFNLENASKTDASGYIQKIIGINNPNYMLDNAHIVISKPWNILRKELSATWGATEKLYNGENIEFELSIGGLASRDKNAITLPHFTCITDCNSSYNAETSKLIFSVKNIGEYGILVDRFSNSNYSFSPTSKTIKVTPATLSTDWTDTNKEYTGNNQEAKLRISGFKLGEEKNYTNETLNNFFVIQSGCEYRIYSQSNGALVIAFSAKNAGTYNVKLEKVISDNYTVATTSTNFTISKKELTGAWLNNNLIYNGANQCRTYRISALNQTDVSKMLVGDFTTSFDGGNVELTKGTGYIDLNFYAKDAKSYNVNINAVDLAKFSNNFAFTNKVNYTFSIAPRLLSVSWKDTPSLMYDDTQKEITATVLNTCGEDVIDLVYKDNKAKEAGTYMASITTTNPNYTTNSSNNKTWKILKKQLTVSYGIVDSENRELSNAVYDGKYKYFKVKYQGFAGDDLTTAVANTNFAYSFNNNNYITTAGSVVEGAYFVSKFKAIDAKSYTINLTSHTLANYDVSLTNTFNISPLKSEINWNYSTPFIYAKTAYSISPIISNIKTREDTETADRVIPSLQNNQYINAGTYTAKIIGVSNSNYYIDSIANTLDWRIEKRTVIIAWDSISLIFNDDHQQKLASASNLCYNDSIYFTYNFALMNSLGNYGAYSSQQTINKGSYKVKVTDVFGSSSANYQLPTVVQETAYEITARKLTATIGGANYTYDGTNKSLITLNITGFPTYSEAYNFTINNIDYQSGATLVKDSVSSTSCSFGFIAKNAGSYEAIVSGCKNNSNYIFDSCNESHTISPRKINVNWAQSDYIYDGTAKDFIATIANIVSGDSVSITYSYSGTSVLGAQIQSPCMTDSGIYNVSITALNNNNYTIAGATNLSNTFTINRKQILVSYTGTSHIYNGKHQGLIVSVTGFVDKDKSLFVGNPLIYSHSGCQQFDIYNGQANQLTISAVNVGTYNMAVTGLTTSFDSSNYVLSSTVNTSYTISKTTISVNWSNASLIYNGITQSVTATINSTIYENELYNSKDVVNISLTGNTGIMAGGYTASINGIDNENYQLPSISAKSWTISTKTLDLSWTTNNTFTYDGQPHEVTLTISGFQSNDAINKTISNFISATGSMTVDRLVVDGTNIKLSFNKIDAGLYTYQLNTISDSNYIFTLKQDTLTINKRPAILVWNYSSPFNYDGSTKSVGCYVENTCIRSDTMVKDIVTVILSDYSKTNAGAYNANATSLSNSNYALPSSVVKNWVINKAKLTSTWSNCGSASYDGLTHYATLKVLGFVNGEASSMTTSSFTSTPAYLITKETNSVVLSFGYKDAKAYSFEVTEINNQNYEFTRTTGQISVTKPQLSISWIGSNSIYDGASHNIKAYIGGLVNGEESSENLSKFKYSFSNGSSSISPTISSESGSLILTFSVKDVATYSLSITDYNGNYTILDKTTNKITINVSPKTVNIIWSGSDRYDYNGISQGKTMNLSGIASNDISTFKNNISTSGVTPIITSDTSGVSYYFAPKNVGAYQVSALAKSTLKNYTFNSQSKTFEITPQLLESNWSTSTGEWTNEYNGQNKTIVLTISGFVNEEKFTPSNFTSSRIVSAYDDSASGVLKISYNIKDSGVYNLSVSSFNNSNYTFITASKTYTINKKALTALWTGNSSTYDGTAQGYDLIISGMSGADVTIVKNCLDYALSNITPIITTDYAGIKFSFKAVNAGDYSAVVKGNSSLNNYELATQTKLFNIGKHIISIDQKSIQSGNLKFNGLIAEDLISSADYTLSIFKDAQHTENVILSDLKTGTYYYHVDLIGNSNYSLNISNGSFEIGVN